MGLARFQRLLDLVDKGVDQVRGAAAETLRLQGYTILEASNGVDALNAADEYRGNQIHLLLTDMVMPLMGGAQLGEKFQGSLPKGQDTLHLWLYG